MTSKHALRLPTTPAPLQSPAVASARRTAAPRARENNAIDRALPSAHPGRKYTTERVEATSKGASKHSQSTVPATASAFPAIEYLFQTLEDAVYSGAFQVGSAAEHRLLELVGAAKRELRGTAQHIAQLEAQNSELEDECRRYRRSVSKIQTQSETLRRSSRGKDVLCDAQLQKLVVMLREVHGYEDEPALSEDEQQEQEQQLELSDVDCDNDDDNRRSSSSSSAGGDDATLDDSNQTEEDPTSDDDDESLSPRNAIVPLEAASSASVRPSSSKPPHSLLSVTVAEPLKKTVREPKPPRGSSGAPTRASAAKGSRLKFQFPDTAIGTRSSFDDDDDDVAASLDDKRTWADPAHQRRRFSSSAAIAATVPLRRKSFTMKRSPAKRIAVTASGESETTLPASAPSSSGSSASRWATRRKSTSACYPARRGSSSSSNARSPGKWKLDSANGRRESAAFAASPRASSQMVVRVRERKLDGVPELVIRKKPARFVVWQWHERQVRMPLFPITLGPQQHGVMLRQLRYVKSVMHDLPWAKAQLKDLLASYTQKDLTKEQLYPQLTHLSHHVQSELDAKAAKQRALALKKHHLTLQLTLAAGAVNDLRMLKFGRRGKPHETQLRYDPSDPTRLHWLRKNGDRSDEFLTIDDLEVRAQLETAVLKRAARKYALDPNSCVSLTTPGGRSLDLQLKSPLQRDWLLNALRDIIAFAKQYRAAGAFGRRQQQLQQAQSHKDLRSLALVARR